MGKRKLIILQIIFWSCVTVFLSCIFMYIEFMKDKGTAITGKRYELNYEVPLENMHEIEVDLVSQDLYIYETDEPMLIVKQIANKSIPEEERLRLAQYEHKVKVEKKNKMRFKAFNFGHWHFNERVEIYVPKTYNKSLNFKTISGTIGVSDLVTNVIECQTTSGDIEMINISAEAIKVNTTSGDIEVEGIDIHTLEGTNISGDLEIEGICDQVEGKTVSGNIGIALMQHPRQIKVESVSGDIDLTFAQTKGFDLEFDSTSGEFESDFDVMVKNKKHYSYRDESAKIRVKTVSGDLEINKY